MNTSRVLLRSAATSSGLRFGCGLRFDNWSFPAMLLLLVMAGCGGGGGGADGPVGPTGPGTGPVVRLPAPPSQLAAVARSDSVVDLSWADNSDNEAGFKIERATAAGGPYTQIATTAPNVAHHSDTALAASSAYHYRVRATGSDGDSDFTAPASVTTAAAAPVPEPPSNLRATATTASSISLTWADNSGNETGFGIERAPAAAGPYAEIATALANVAAFTDTGLAASTAYHYRVRACDDAGTSSYSNTLSTQTSAAASLPAAPSAAAAVATSDTSISVRWTDNADNETGFRIERAPDAAGPYALVAIKPANAVLHVDIGLSAATRYHYRVWAVNPVGDSARTPAVAAMTLAPPVTVPPAPTALVATAATAASITLSWADNSSNETGFEVLRASAAAGPYSLIATTAANAFTHVDGGLSASTAYHYRVRAINSAGASALAAVATATTLAPAVTLPAAPSALVVAATSPSTVTLGWTDNSNNETGFSVERATAAAGPYSRVALTAANAVSQGDSGLAAATTYHYRVRATNSAGTSASTPAVPVTTPAAALSLSLQPSLDNLVMVNSLNPAIAGQSYPNGELGVGCNWSYSVLAGQAFVCHQSLMKFDLAALAGKTIDSATLRLSTRLAGVGFHPRTWHIRALATGWNGGVTWAAVSGSSSYVAGRVTGLAAPTQVSQVLLIDVRDMVQRWANGSASNYGMAFGTDSNAFPYATSLDAFSFHSREAGADLAPTLTVTYR